MQREPICVAESVQDGVPPHPRALCAGLGVLRPLAHLNPSKSPDAPFHAAASPSGSGKPSEHMFKDELAWSRYRNYQWMGNHFLLELRTEKGFAVHSRSLISCCKTHG